MALPPLRIYPYNAKNGRSIATVSFQELFVFYQAEVDERLFDRGFLLRRQLRGVGPMGSFPARASGFVEPASVLGPGDGEAADMEAVVPPDPCLDLRVGGALGL